MCAKKGVRAGAAPARKHPLRQPPTSRPGEQRPAPSHPQPSRAHVDENSVRWQPCEQRGIHDAKSFFCIRQNAYQVIQPSGKIQHSCIRGSRHSHPGRIRSPGCSPRTVMSKCLAVPARTAPIEPTPSKPRVLPRRVPVMVLSQRPSCWARKRSNMPPLMQQQVSENIFGHQPAEDPAGIGQQVIPAQGGVEQRLHTGVGGLHPAQVWQAGNHIPDQRRVRQR